MDGLDGLAGPAGDLLGRVDDLLARAGAPERHRIWPLLRRLGALPGDAAAAVAALRPSPLAAAGHAVRDLTRPYEDAAAFLAAAHGPWEGAAAQAYADHRSSLVAHLDGPDGLTGRLAATADYADDLADWAAGGRAALASTLGAALGSAEAVAVVTMDDSSISPPLAAAEIGARVLATVADIQDAAEALLRRWAPELAELPYRPPAGGTVRLDGTTRLDSTTRIDG